MIYLQSLSLRHWTLALIALWISIVALVGVNNYWQDSELWAIVASKYYFNPGTEYYFGTKPLFHLILNLNHQLAGFLHIHPMQLARAWMAINSLGIALCIFRIVRSLRGDAAALFSLVVLGAVSFFCKRAGEVRADLIVTHLYLWWILIFTNKNDRTQRISLVLTSIVTMLLTPKAIFWIMALWPYWIGQINKKYLWQFTITSPLTMGAVVWIFQDPLMFFLRSFNSPEIGASYLGLERFYYLWRFAYENSVLIIFGAFMWRQDTHLKNEDQAYKIQNFSLTAALLLLLYPDKLPFLIAALCPFFVIAICSFNSTQKFAEATAPKIKNLRFALYGVLLLLSLNWTLSLRSHSNHRQKLAVDWIRSEVIKYPGIHVFDPVGILYDLPAHHWFLGPGQGQKNTLTLGLLENYKPEIILYTSKVQYMEPDIAPFLKDHYAGDGAGIFVRKVVFDQPGTKLKTELIRDQLKQNFPRLARRHDIRWIIFWKDETGVSLKQPIDWKTLKALKYLEFRPGTIRVAIQPFEMAFPFNSNLIRLFEFDAEL